MKQVDPAWEVLLTAGEIEALLMRPGYSPNALASARNKLEDAYRPLATLRDADERLDALRQLLIFAGLGPKQ